MPHAMKRLTTVSLLLALACLPEACSNPESEYYIGPCPAGERHIDWISNIGPCISVEAKDITISQGCPSDSGQCYYFETES